MKLVTATVLFFALLVAGSAGAAGPSPSAGPTVTGMLQQGKKLTAATGTWLGTGTPTFAFQWYRCDANGAHCSSIHGSTKPTHVQVAKDVGKTLGLTVRATDSTGTTAAYASLAGLVAAPTSTLVSNAQPPLDGDPIVGQPLKVEAVTWSATASATTYAWLRCNENGRLCTAIAGAANDTYTLAAADLGHTILAAVTGTAGTAKQTLLSLRSGVVRQQPGPLSTAAPSVSGTLQQGKKLTGVAGAWQGSGALTYAFQWYRCDPYGAHCSSIHGATKSTYLEVAKDVGQTLGLTVRATDTTGTTAAYASLAGRVVASTSTIAATAQPTLTGTATVGQALKIAPGTWSATPSATTYSWLRCNANGRACVAIPSQTAASYTLTADDTGHTIVGVVQAGAQASALSMASAVVK
jgi:hypothetical protein